MLLNQRIPTKTTTLQSYSRNRPSKWMLTFVLLGLMVAVVNAAIDENKSTEKKTVSDPQASPASPLSRVTPRDEIYIDDEGLEGSGGRGEIHDDLEKEPDYSGSGFGPDDEDSSPGHHHHNTNTHYSPSSGISSSNSGSSINIGQSNTNSAGIINSNSNIGSGIKTIGKESSTNRKDTSPTIGSKHDTDDYSFGGVVAGSGDGNDNDDNDDKYDDIDNDDTDDLDPDFDNDNDHTDKNKNIDPYNHDKSDRKHIHDLGKNNKNDHDDDNDDEDNENDDDDEAIYTEVTDPNESDSDARLPDRSGETNINKEIITKTNNELGIDLDHTNRNNFPTDSNTNIGAGGVLVGNEVLIMNTKNEDRTASFFAQPGILAAVIGGAVVGLLCAILVVMFIVYRMRKKDEGSYALDEPKRSPAANSYAKNVNNREFYA